jgi:hypothetical protein
VKPDADPGAQGGVAGMDTPIVSSSADTQIVNCSGEAGPPLTSLVTITFVVSVGGGGGGGSVPHGTAVSPCAR